MLSACETGLYDIGYTADEFIGLPGAFRALGAAGADGTLWPVSDAATALLIVKFYELHLVEGVAPPTALKRAQDWLRQATASELKDFAARSNRLSKRHVADIENELGKEALSRSRNAAAVTWIGPKSDERNARPYAHPYFWGGFIYTGL